MSIGPADVASLSSALGAGDFYDQTNAENVYADEEEAKIALNSIRHGINGDLERFGFTELNAVDFSTRSEAARRALTDPTVAIDFSQLGAGQLSDEAKLHLIKDAAA